MSENVFIFGGSGHAKVVIDAIMCAGKDKVTLVIDDSPDRRGLALLGHCIEGGRDILVSKSAATPRGVVAIGDNSARMAVAAWLEANGFGFVTVVHPAASVAASVRLGRGTVVMPLAAVNADTQIGRHVIVNTSVSVDHDCVIGDGVHLAPGCRLCGDVHVGHGALLGAGTVVVPGIRIGSGAIVGAGATVLDHVPDGCRVVGSPARPLLE